LEKKKYINLINKSFLKTNKKEWTDVYNKERRIGLRKKALSGIMKHCRSPYNLKNLLDLKEK